MNFLIVEDDNIQLTGLKHIIEEEYADAVVNTASTYNDAITIIDSFDIDIFLLDIDLGGGKTGLDVCGYLRRIPKYNDTPVIFITDITVPNLDVINKYHCQYYFSKPYDRIDVVGGINSVLTQPDDQTSRIRVKDIQGILFHISMDEIIYVCASGHHKHIFTSDGDFIVTNPTFESILQAAGDVPLVRCHIQSRLHTELRQIQFTYNAETGSRIHTGRAQIQNYYRNLPGEQIMAAYFDFLSKILFDTFVFLVFLMAIYNVKFSQIAKRLPPLFLLTLPVSLIATVTDSMLIFTLITYIYCFVFYSLVFRYPPMKIITGYAITLIIMTILNLIQMVVIMQFTDNPFTNTSTYITEAMAFIIAILLYKFGHMDKLYDALIVKNQVSRNIILAVFALMVSMVLYQRISPKDFMNIFMTFLFIVILILILYSGMYKNYMSLRESRKQLQSYEQYLPIIEDLIDQVRMRQHDYNNELQAISMLPISYTDYDSLAAALSNELDTSCNDHVIKNSYLLRINMKLIAGFLFSKMNLAQEHNINLDIDVKNSTLTSKAAEFELLDVMSILVDNAFDATEDGGMIKVIIDSDGKTTTVETFNAGSQLTAEMRKNFFAKGYSTKPLKDGAYSRGIGLYKLKQLTSKYHGEILLDNQTVDGQNCIHFVVSI